MSQHVYYPLASLAGISFDIRQLIYEYALLVKDPTALTTVSLDSETYGSKTYTNCLLLDFQHVSTALFRVNRKMSRESLEYFYTNNHFVHVRTGFSCYYRDTLMQALPVKLFRLEERLHSAAILRVSLQTLQTALDSRWNILQAGLSLMIRSSDLGKLFEFMDARNYACFTKDKVVKVSLDFNLKIRHNKKWRPQTTQGMMSSIRFRRIQTSQPWFSPEHDPTIQLDISGKLNADQRLQIEKATNLHPLHRSEIEAMTAECIAKAKVLSSSENSADRIKAYEYLIAAANLNGGDINVLLSTDQDPRWERSPSRTPEQSLLFFQLLDQISLIFSSLNIRELAMATSLVALRVGRNTGDPLQLRAIEEITLRVVNSYLAEEEWEEAMRHIIEVCNRYPNSSVLRNAVPTIRSRRIQAEKQKIHQDEVEKLTMRLVNMFIMEESWDKALAEADSALTLYPDSVVLQNAVCDILVLQFEARSEEAERLRREQKEIEALAMELVSLSASEKVIYYDAVSEVHSALAHFPSSKVLPDAVLKLDAAV
ncbi:hypothetical protein GLAREA_08318 [Glarea lozoyensis ATCC 20868]|uniref:Uncharacterized protein n=1 Tax=Glarea lozoyensis (strain ATCC 20868 / MF5171) TaxID=1116229 RepID=S3CXB5_GLAL2|nr:uncharacterized protein GLAREA_08318 [Glarea lozoyensis ATCC 20868]EPE24466.1 hypothetical protein GLAREA_08318 [Glarea lozoyensis ATCC 20868]